MDVSGIIRLILWAAALGIAVIYGTRIIGRIGSHVRV